MFFIIKRSVVDRVVSTVLVVAWSTVIFLFSAQSGEDSGGMSGGLIEAMLSVFYPKFNDLTLLEQENLVLAWQFFVRKAAHFSEYAILGVLSANAARAYFKRNRLRFFLPAAFCFLCAVSDELHQYFVPDRACRAFDIMIDTIGSLVGIVLFFVLMIFIKKVKNKGKSQSTKINEEKTV